MVSSGVIVDRLLIKLSMDETIINNKELITHHHHPNTKQDLTLVAETVEEFREELLQIAEQITT